MPFISRVFNLADSSPLRVCLKFTECLSIPHAPQYLVRNNFVQEACGFDLIGF